MCAVGTSTGYNYKRPTISPEDRSTEGLHCTLSPSLRAVFRAGGKKSVCFKKEERFFLSIESVFLGIETRETSQVCSTGTATEASRFSRGLHEDRYWMLSTTNTRKSSTSCLKSEKPYAENRISLYHCAPLSALQSMSLQDEYDRRTPRTPRASVLRGALP